MRRFLWLNGFADSETFQSGLVLTPLSALLNGKPPIAANRFTVSILICVTFGPLSRKGSNIPSLLSQKPANPGYPA